jgi:hypothetical protein
MTLFCKHNWHIHKTGSLTPYSKFVHGVYRRSYIHYEDLPSAMIFLVCSIGVAVSSGIISIALFPTIDAWSAVIGLALGGTYAISYALINNPSKWVEKDKTCLKCNKIVMDATNQEHRAATKAENEADERQRLAPLRAEADRRYKGYMAMRAKAEPYIPQ